MNKKLITIASIFAVSSLTVLAEEVAADTTVEAPAPAATLFEEFAEIEALSNFSMSVGVGYESQYVFRGIELAGGIVSPSVDMEYELSEDAKVYVGYWGAYSTDTEGCEENDLFMGVKYAYDFVSFDAGYTAYTYTSDCDDTNEIKFVATFDTSALFANGLNLEPYIGFFYDFDYEDQFVTEIGIAYSIPLSQYITGGEWATLDLAYNMGFASYCSSSDLDDYFYTGFTVDANFNLNDIAKFSIGLRYAYNNMKGCEAENSNIWFGTGLSFGF